MISTVVESILRDSPRTRDSDTELMLVYMQKMGMCLTPQQINTYRSLPAMETITRVRRSFQENGKYEASPTAKRTRHIKAAIVQHNTPEASPERVERVLTESIHDEVERLFPDPPPEQQSLI